MGKKSNVAEASGADLEVEVVLDNHDGDELSVAGANPEDVASVVRDIESEEGKREAYASQPAGGEGTETIVTAGETKPGKTKKEKTPAKPRVSLLSHKASEVIVLLAAALPGGMLTLDAKTGEGLTGAALERIDKLDKKTREKAVNLVQSIVANKRPSVYTVQAAKALRSTPGSLSLKGLTDYFLTTCGYKPGTARRQASEMFALFPAFGIATKAEGKGTPLVLNEGSLVLSYIESVATVASAPVAAAA